MKNGAVDDASAGKETTEKPGCVSRSKVENGLRAGKECREG